MDCQALLSDRHVPESVHRVVDTLCEHERMTMKEVQTDCGLARRTVYGALRKLRDMGLVQELPNLRDTRQSWYVLRPS